MERFRVLLVDDFQSWRHCLRSLLQQHRDDVEIVGESSDGLQAIELAQELQPDLILLDIGLPKLDGIATARRLRGLSPHSKIIFVSEESSAELITEALATGAQDYIVKTNASRLLSAIDAALVAQELTLSGV